MLIAVGNLGADVAEAR